ncbi:hypothetical protein ASE12_04325 [Aeromicrobium sp. Root236]|nr:hypothetical protein ASE12_04325 [Aeromicrobium sp. Root236]
MENKTQFQSDRVQRRCPSPNIAEIDQDRPVRAIDENVLTVQVSVGEIPSNVQLDLIILSVGSKVGNRLSEFFVRDGLSSQISQRGTQSFMIGLEGQQARSESADDLRRVGRTAG